jgi:hypothetical protein
MDQNIALLDLSLYHLIKIMEGLRGSGSFGIKQGEEEVRELQLGVIQLVHA